MPNIPVLLYVPNIIGNDLIDIIKRGERNRKCSDRFKTNKKNIKLKDRSDSKIYFY